MLLVVDGFPKALGGGERVVLRLAELLPRYGYRVSILTFKIDPESAFRPQTAPCPVYLLPLPRTYDLNALRAAFVLRRFLRQERVQIVQTFFESSDIWAGLVTRVLSSAKLIWSRRDMGILRGRKHTYAYRWLRRCPHLLLAVSAQVAQHAIEVDGVNPERVRVLHNGLNLERFPATDPHDLLARAPQVTTVGNIRRVKGHDVLVRAARLVADRRPDVRFTIAGEVLEPAYFQELELLVQKLGLQDQVHFIGKVTDLAAHLGSATVFVLPSRSEGFSNSLIEAMAAGIPVVASDVGGNAEAICDGESGYLVPADDAGLLAERILTLLESPEVLLAMSGAARRIIEENFSEKAMMCRLLAAYGEAQTR